MTFQEFGFHSNVMDGIDAINYKEPTVVQAQVIPMIMQGKDIIASAQTGTGKTAAFLLPILHNLIVNPPKGNSISALIIVPTRELAIQIVQNLEGISYFTNVSCIAAYGGNTGEAFAQEKKALSSGADIVICTPGKMISHIKMGYVSLTQLRFLVLDEADRMLDMGFFDDIMRIINTLPKQRQNLLFSATMPSKIRTLAKQILHNPYEVNIAISKPNANITQRAYVVYDTQKIPLIELILQDSTYERVIIFCGTKVSVKELNKNLKQRKLNVEEIHSDLEQKERNQVLLDFTNKKIRILVATDVLSRGIDIEDIDLVVNYDVPHDGEDYVHRIGRTARASNKGTAVTLVSPKEIRRMMQIETLIEQTVQKGNVPASLGETPLYEAATFVKRNGNNKGSNNNPARKKTHPHKKHPRRPTNTPKS